MEEECTAEPNPPNEPRMVMGWGVGMDPLESPMREETTCPPLNTMNGLTPKNAGSHSTRSANFPASTLPT